MKSPREKSGIMDTIKITVSMGPAGQWVADVLMAGMAEVGFDTFVETDGGFEAYIPENLYNRESLVAVIGEVSVETVIRFAEETIAARNWNEEWEKNYFRPLVISDQVVVRAPFHSDYPKCRYEIVIEPKMAFGTGNHETTSLMMEVILELDLAGKRLLDMGCGTGILGILASMTGAGPVTAIDIDEWSYNATVENSALNNILNITAIIGDSGLLGSDAFDVVLANIQKNVILNDLPAYSGVLQPGGQMLLSGFYRTDLTDIRKVAELNGLVFKEFRERNNWVVAIFTKS
jgi:ribosomal protein L11 methyltransferase